MSPIMGTVPAARTCNGILIPGKRGRLLSVLYTAGGEGLHPDVLLLHGIPGCDLKGQLPQ